MKHLKFIIDATAMLEMENTHFDILFRAASGHYDRRVKEATTQGFFMYGFRNRRTWAEQDGKTVFEAEWSSSQLNLMLKAMEMSDETGSHDVRRGLAEAFHSLQAEIKRLNNWK